MKTAAEGGYDGTIFHRMVRGGMVQGGDPLSKDPSKRDAYGTGGLNAVKDDPPAPKMISGIDSGGDGAGKAGQRRRAVLHRARRPAHA